MCEQYPELGERLDHSEGYDIAIMKLDTKWLNDGGMCMNLVHFTCCENSDVQSSSSDQMISSDINDSLLPDDDISFRGSGSSGDDEAAELVSNFPNLSIVTMVSSI